MKQSLLALLFLSTAYAHAPVVLQMYGDADQSQIREKVEDFAEERGLSIERPEVVPATSSAEITIVHSSTYESASTAWELADLLRALGSDVSLRRVRLKNHLVTGNRVGVFVRDESVSGHADDDVGISELICSRDEE